MFKLGETVEKSMQKNEIERCAKKGNAKSKYPKQKMIYINFG